MWLSRAINRRWASRRRWLRRAPYRALAAVYRKRFHGAWVVMDRVHDADDNGERLFEYLRTMRPDINAWFVLEKDTPDWRRIGASGETRLVAHGSLRWKLLMLNAAWLLSSHADIPIVRPPEIMRLVAGATWKFGFLQHGVTKDDLSLWLNRRWLDLFVVSTEPELDSVVADGTSYIYTRKETRNTGLPRFDRLLGKGREVGAANRDLVIIAPTWRNWLTLPPEAATQRREVDDTFWTSEYYRNWLAVLTSDEVRAASRRRGWRIGFMPHPNVQSILAEMNLPSDVEPLAFAGVDVQALYARCALLVTDYSSVAFNIAYLDAPVVYFQFDRDQMLGGLHVGRQGYFDYFRDGFGPVVTEPDEAIKAIVAQIELGSRPTPEYQARINATLVNRDGRACERVVAAVEELSRPYRRDPEASAYGATGWTPVNASETNQT
jgi:CDP-glycerol glycerophosphotransferase (TagB/SpsB family)